MFLVLLTYLVPLERVDKFVVAHREFLDRNYKKGLLVVSGPKVPRTGGVILARVQDRKILERLLEEDPFKINGIASHEVIEFNPVKYDAGFERFLPPQK